MCQNVSGTVSGIAILLREVHEIKSLIISLNNACRENVGV
jgi:hypothetical protein